MPYLKTKRYFSPFTLLIARHFVIHARHSHVIICYAKLPNNHLADIHKYGSRYLQKVQDPPRIRLRLTRTYLLGETVDRVVLFSLLAKLIWYMVSAKVCTRYLYDYPMNPLHANCVCCVNSAVNVHREVAGRSEFRNFLFNSKSPIDPKHRALLKIMIVETHWWQKRLTKHRVKKMNTLDAIPIRESVIKNIECRRKMWKWTRIMELHWCIYNTLDNRNIIFWIFVPWCEVFGFWVPGSQVLNSVFTSKIWPSSLFPHSET